MPVELTGPLGAVVVAAVILLALATVAVASYEIGTAPGRRAPRWALGCMIAAFALNGIGNLLHAMPLRALVGPAQVAATVLVIVELVRRRRHRMASKP